MTLIEQYKNGGMQEVYAQIAEWGADALLPEKFPCVDEVLTETFKRVAHNLQVIYLELQKIDYVFFNRPFHSPLHNTDKLLKKLDKEVKKFGYVPLSLKYFYKIVGGVDFGWNYSINNEFMWEMADPIQVTSLDELISYLSDAYWKDDMMNYVEDENFGYAFLELSADDLHKDNVSGGAPYSLKITPKPSVDSELLYEPHDTSFINYLRICFDYCGFPGNPDSDSFRQFCEQVKPQLKPL